MRHSRSDAIHALLVLLLHSSIDCPALCGAFSFGAAPPWPAIGVLGAAWYSWRTRWGFDDVSRRG
jgi:hypothetical protein